MSKQFLHIQDDADTTTTTEKPIPVLKIKPDGRAPRVKSNVRTQKRPQPSFEPPTAGGKSSRAGAGRSLDLDAEDPIRSLNGLNEDQVCIDKNIILTINTFVLGGFLMSVARPLYLYKPCAKRDLKNEK